MAEAITNNGQKKPDQPTTINAGFAGTKVGTTSWSPLKDYVNSLPGPARAEYFAAIKGQDVSPN